MRGADRDTAERDGLSSGRPTTMVARKAVALLAQDCCYRCPRKSSSLLVSLSCFQAAVYTPIRAKIFGRKIGPTSRAPFP